LRREITLIVCGFCLATALARAEGSDLGGIYIEEKSPHNRIELLSDGRYYQVGGSSSGTWQKNEGRLVCITNRGERTEFLILGGKLADAEGQTWIPLAARPPIPWKDASPLSIIVLDEVTRAPLKEFSYTYTLKTATETYDPLIVRPIAVRSESGTCSILAPRSCEIEIQIEGPTIVGGYGSWHKHVVFAANTDRRIEVPVKTGLVVEGIAVDGRTRHPIEGVLVSPLVFAPPGFRSDRNRAVRSDAHGKFRIGGISPDFGINAWHPDYVDFVAGKVADGKIELDPGEVITGTVRDPSGKALTGVNVADGGDKTVQTRSDGSFVLRGASRRGVNQTYNLDFAKEGYLNSKFSCKPPVQGAISIVLNPQPRVSGHVLDASGRPISQFTIHAGPGKEPGTWCCSSKAVSDRTGSFSLPIRTDYGEDGRVWIGVKAPGYAPWEWAIDIQRQSSEIVANLKVGVCVRGSIKAHDGCRVITAKLLPRPLEKDTLTGDASQRQELGRMEMPVDARGVFRFDHVALGAYVLAVAGPTISPIGREIQVREADVDVGALAVSGTGSLVGVVYDHDQRGRPWAFADCNVTFSDGLDAALRFGDRQFKHLAPIEFKTDEQGRFRLDNVPVGNVAVNIPYQLTADMFDAYVRLATVREGSVTEVRFFDTSGTWELACQFVIGDGSQAHFACGTGIGAKRKVANVTTRRPMFRIELLPKEKLLSHSAPDWDELDDRKRILLHDIRPGKYRVVISDWLMSRGFLGPVYEKDVEIAPKQSTLTVSLGAGSITGAVQSSHPCRTAIHIIALGKNHHAVHHARCDTRGNFCVRYLRPDEYTLFAHDFDAGWTKLAAVSSANNTLDVGGQKLAPGGAIAVHVPRQFAADESVAIGATDASGITIKESDWPGLPGSDFALSSLWPGKWIVTMTKGGKVLAKGTVVLHGPETVSCELVP
jgi:hypothetical protein